MKSPAGLHLWKVNVKFSSVHLWITTRKHCLKTAFNKAQRFVESDKGRKLFKFGADIKTIEHQGTIDA